MTESERRVTTPSHESPNSESAEMKRRVGVAAERLIELERNPDTSGKLNLDGGSVAYIQRRPDTVEPETILIRLIR